MSSPHAVPPWGRGLPGPQLLCCGHWHAIIRLPLHVPCCGRVYLVRRVVEAPRHEGPWYPVPIGDAVYARN